MNTITDCWTCPPEMQGQINVEEYRYDADTDRVWRRITYRDTHPSEVRYDSAMCPVGYECDFQNGVPPMRCWCPECASPFAD